MVNAIIINPDATSAIFNTHDQLQVFRALVARNRRSEKKNRKIDEKIKLCKRIIDAQFESFPLEVNKWYVDKYNGPNCGKRFLVKGYRKPAVYGIYEGESKEVDKSSSMLVDPFNDSDSD